MKNIEVKRNGEFEEQRKTDILKRNKYVKLEIIIDEEDIKNPYINLKNTNTKLSAMSSLYKTLEVTKELFEKNFPETVEYANKHFETKIGEIIKNDDI